MLKHRRISWVSKKIMQPACAVTRDLHCYHLDSNFQTQIMYLVVRKLAQHYEIGSWCCKVSCFLGDRVLMLAYDRLCTAHGIVASDMHVWTQWFLIWLEIDGRANVTISHNQSQRGKIRDSIRHMRCESR